MNTVFSSIVTKFETNCTPVRLVTFSVGAKTIIILHTKHFNPTVILYYIRTLHLLHGIPRSVLCTLNDIQQWIKKKEKMLHRNRHIFSYYIWSYLCTLVCMRDHSIHCSPARLFIFSILSEIILCELYVSRCVSQQ